MIAQHSPIPGFEKNPYAVHLSLDTLLPLITSKTRLIAFSACSNILGSAIDVEAVVKAIRDEAQKKGARKIEVCVDCVAYAPHRRIDVRKWDVDYCYFSFYKVSTEDFKYSLRLAFIYPLFCRFTDPIRA